MACAEIANKADAKAAAINFVMSSSDAERKGPENGPRPAWTGQDRSFNGEAKSTKAAICQK
jgi:hypothetical protein